MQIALTGSTMASLSFVAVLVFAQHLCSPGDVASDEIPERCTELDCAALAARGAGVGATPGEQQLECELRQQQHALRHAVTGGGGGIAHPGALRGALDLAVDVWSGRAVSGAELGGDVVSEAGDAAGWLPASSLRRPPLDQLAHRA